ncbi:uracil-DNA glycosylase [Oesophagostomum dentatum]|uniref:Uracil-DNA glycosylase n=1 Tax=Oesophagostomum dentatum TaxID=61180 RepID=A0A0B1SNJ9_OESDE|nr:uracil-DNA glycosylase [Oesophagostomum dentatum]
MATPPAKKIPDMFVRALKRKASLSTTVVSQDDSGKKTKTEQIEVRDENVAVVRTGFCLFSMLNDPHWRTILKEEFSKKYMQEIESFLRSQYDKNVPVFPPREEIFSAFNLTPIESIRAHGLSFSVKKGVPPPPSLKNIYKELSVDIPGFVIPNHGFLKNWATQGVFMLNATLTVESGKANSHEKIGWQKFTDKVITLISSQSSGVVFLLWGGFAQKKAALIDMKKHAVIKTAHPSPLSAHKWFGCRCFSRANAELARMGRDPIDWASL